LRTGVHSDHREPAGLELIPASRACCGFTADAREPGISAMPGLTFRFLYLSAYSIFSAPLRGILRQVVA